MHIDTLTMEISMYFKGLQVKIFIRQCISVTEDCFMIIAKIVVPDKIIKLEILLTPNQCTCLLVSKMKRLST